jgi:N-acylneuraminate cytidylyltransferase
MLDGKPLIVHSIDAARDAEEVDWVVVSTDDPEIAQVATLAGAQVVMRPQELASDMATSESALLHTLERLEEEHGVVPEITVFLQCTSPLTIGFDIDETVRALVDAGADSALAVAPYHHFLWRHAGEGGCTGVNHDHRVRQRRQEREPQYLETGAVYVMKTAGLKKSGHRFFGSIAMHVMPRTRVWEIDDPTDLIVARALIEARRSKEISQVLPLQPDALVLDFDGVFTDNAVIVFQDGTEAVRCSRSDGAGLARLKATGLPMLVLSAEINPVVSARCEKLQIPCMHGVTDKRPVLLRWLKNQGCRPENTIYVGNDLADIPCMLAVGCGVAVADAQPEVLDSANLVLRSSGGHGAIRELSEFIIDTARGQMEASR